MKHSHTLPSDAAKRLLAFQAVQEIQRMTGLPMRRQGVLSVSAKRGLSQQEAEALAKITEQSSVPALPLWDDGDHAFEIAQNLSWDARKPRSKVARVILRIGLPLLGVGLGMGLLVFSQDSSLSNMIAGGMIAIGTVVTIFSIMIPIALVEQR